MLSAFMQREKDNFSAGSQPGKAHTEGFRRAIEGAFDIADTFEAERRRYVRSARPGAQGRVGATRGR